MAKEKAKEFVVPKSNRIKIAKATIGFNIVGYFFITLIALICLLPFIMIISGSFSKESLIVTQGYSLLPRGLSVSAYETIFKNPMIILNSYGVTILITVVGTVCGLFITAMTGYVLCRQDFKYRNVLSFYFYFTTLFSGGMVSSYIFMIQVLNLKDSLLALILPFLVNVFYLLIMRSFMASVPVSIIESAKIDGAGEFRIFIQLVLPLAKAGLATIGLFIALEYWNDWYNAMLYINSSDKYPLQYRLYNMISSQAAMAQLSQVSNVKVENMPTQTLKLAMACVATGPIILVYPFVQKFFVKGITIGSVKG